MVAITQRQNVHLRRARGPADDTEQMESPEARHSDQAGNEIAFSTCTAAEVRETNMWVVKMCDERNEILLGFPPAISLSEDVRQEGRSRWLWLVPDQNISPSAEIYFLPPGPPSPPITHPLFLWPSSPGNKAATLLSFQLHHLFLCWKLSFTFMASHPSAFPDVTLILLIKLGALAPRLCLSLPVSRKSDLWAPSAGN